MSIEFTLAAPLLMLTILTIVQFVLWSHATHIAQTAAAQGLSAARVHGGTVAAGTARAQHILDELGDGPLTDTTVHATRTSERARVDIHGTATPVVPFLSLPVHAEATGPVERLVPDAVGR